MLGRGAEVEVELLRVSGEEEVPEGAWVSRMRPMKEE